ncbi:acetyltransferase [Algoriphagus algorifonticola]|uniref:acetyltransferase n=1 Tax=Algoriphagus algorifonticola TaxID=2593007 RepID=UPI00119DFCD8|nr:acetyltransferase [Algoriphagus algorifonticola]
MVIAGAGGHGLEVFETLKVLNYSESEIFFYDMDDTKKSTFIYPNQLITSMEDVRLIFEKTPLFCLGVGNPIHRRNLMNKLYDAGGLIIGIKAKSVIAQSACDNADLMEFAFCGPGVKLGKGVLINTRAHIHHECEIGDFTEIGPAAIILGAVRIGENCRIGAGAIVLPGVVLGNNVIVGAGAVVTKHQESNKLVKGIPAR